MQLPEELKFITNARLPQKSTDVSMDGKICVITGTTSGVGYVTAKRLAQGGAHLVMVCRNREKADSVRKELENVYGVIVEVILADFRRLSDVREAATEILECLPRIDVLINNVGVHQTKRIITPDGLETAFCVNHLAPFLLTRLLLDRIKASAPSRIIQVNSQGHRFGGLDLDDLTWERRRYRGLKGYGAAKTAQLYTIWEFADRLEGSGVTINGIHPGEVKTNIGMNNGLLYRCYNRYVIRWFLRNPSISAEAIYYLSAAPEMADITGRFFNLTIDERPAPHALDRELGQRVWVISEQLTGLSHT